MGKFYQGLTQDLTLYARQLAWFHSAPVDKAKQKTVAGKEPDVPKSRLAQIEQNGGKPLFPPIGEGSYVLEYWQDLGLTQAGGMGPVALSAAEIYAWQKCCGIVLQPWEFHILRGMSRAYLAQSHESENPDCPPPYGDPVNVFDREVVGKKVTNAFKAFLQVKR